MLKKVQVPAAGQSKTFGITGVSFIVASAPAYEKIEHVPLLSFNAPGSQLPALTRSIFGNPEGKFNRLAVTGTEQSEGDELVIFSTLACLDDFLNFDALATKKVYLKPSFSVEAGDDVEELSELQIANSDGDLPNSMYVSTTDENLNFAFDVDPEQGAGALAHRISPGEVLKIEGLAFIQAFRFRAATALDTTEVTFTMEY